MYNTNLFVEMNEKELMEQNGGGVWEAAVGITTLCGAALVGGFKAGRQFVKDVRNKFF